MKIFQVKLDVSRFQYFLPQDEKIWKSNDLIFDCTPKLANWVPPPVYVLKPKLQQGNFSGLLMNGALIIDSATTELLRNLLEPSGELLPLLYENKRFYILNILECFNLLDQDRTEWADVNGQRGSIKRYAFHKTRMPEVPLFKIPETCKAEMLTIEGLKDAEDEFKPTVERLGLTGVAFKEIWSS